MNRTRHVGSVTSTVLLGHVADKISLKHKKKRAIKKNKRITWNQFLECYDKVCYKILEWETKPTLPVENYSLCPIVNEVSQEDGLNHASKYQTSDSTKEAVLETAKTELFSKTDGFATESEDQVKLLSWFGYFCHFK